MKTLCVLLRRAGILAALSAPALVLTILEFATPRPRSPTKASGARLLYDVTFLLGGREAMATKVGELELAETGEETVDGAACSVVEVRSTSTHRAVEALCPVRERWRLKVDREGRFSRGYEHARRDGDGEIVDRQSFDYANGRAPWSRTEGDRVRTGDVALPGPVQDPISWVFHVRDRVARRSVPSADRRAAPDPSGTERAAGERKLAFTIVDRGYVCPAALEIAPEEEEIDLGPLGRVRALRVSGKVSLGGIGTCGKGDRVDQQASLFWLDAETGILVRARVKVDYGLLGLELREAEGVPALGIGGSVGP